MKSGNPTIEIDLINCFHYSWK